MYLCEISWQAGANAGITISNSLADRTRRRVVLYGGGGQRVSHGMIIAWPTERSLRLELEDDLAGQANGMTHGTLDLPSGTLTFTAIRAN